MTAVLPEPIKSGAEIVADFVERLQADDRINLLTLNTIKELYKTGKFTKTRLLQALELARSTKVEPEKTSTDGIG
jgi:hypothetical protein